MTGIPKEMRREFLKRDLASIDAGRLDERADRYLAVEHQGIIPAHHFAAASAECIDLYRDGYFLSVVMVSQAVAEAIFRFVLDRNGLKPEGDRPAMSAVLVERQIISDPCAEALVRIWRSFRCDVHHMNPKVATIPFRELAKRNIQDLATVERELFAYRTTDGKLYPVQPKYWDPDPDGTVGVFLRLL